VLTDKTGTLTQNIMGFVWASFGGRLFGAEATARGVPRGGGGSLAGGWL
jgi:magnesium-transporting ATPase (P-type)